MEIPVKISLMFISSLIQIFNSDMIIYTQIDSIFPIAKLEAQ